MGNELSVSRVCCEVIFHSEYSFEKLLYLLQACSSFRASLNVRKFRFDAKGKIGHEYASCG